MALTLRLIEFIGHHFGVEDAVREKHKLRSRFFRDVLHKIFHIWQVESAPETLLEFVEIAKGDGDVDELRVSCGLQWERRRCNPTPQIIGANPRKSIEAPRFPPSRCRPTRSPSP